MNQFTKINKEEITTKLREKKRYFKEILWTVVWELIR